MIFLWRFPAGRAVRCIFCGLASLWGKEALSAPQKDAASITNAPPLSRKPPSDHGAALPPLQNQKIPSDGSGGISGGKAGLLRSSNILQKQKTPSDLDGVFKRKATTYSPT